VGAVNGGEMHDRTLTDSCKEAFSTGREHSGKWIIKS